MRGALLVSSSTFGERHMQTRRTFLATIAGASAFALAACGGGNSNEAATETEAPAATSDGTDAKGEGVMTYDEYMAAAVDDEVVIECFVQGKQSWWENKATIYAADADGGYFIYNATCSEDDYAKLVDGQKIKVTGYKTEWSGEIEIADASYEILDGFWLAIPEDVTELLGSDALAEHMNRLVSFTDMTIVAYDDSGAAFAYKNEADKTDDLYFKAAVGDQVYDFCVEYYLCNEETEVYKAVEALNVGDVVDLTGFLYWYEGPNPHITSVVVK